jgi:hypothetical protein
MGKYLPTHLRSRLEDADNRHCAYCHTREEIAGQPMTVDHVIPESQDGPTEFENLCFCCRRCNEFKGSKTAATDPLTGEIEALFHPRREKWREHFTWDETGTVVIGLTKTGRATVTGLKMNDAIVVAARLRWVAAGWHPPDF